MTKPRVVVGSAVALLLALTGSLAAQEGDAGETAEARKLKDRSAAPSAADIDPAVNLQALLSRPCCPGPRRTRFRRRRARPSRAGSSLVAVP